MNTELRNTIEQFMDETMDLNDLPGLAVGVSIGLEGDSFDGEFEYTGARGYRDYETREPLQAGDIFHCASVSKLFTSSAIMKLVEAGALGLYDRLCNLLPDLKFEGPDEDGNIGDWRFGEIRLWNMLTHTSGLGDCFDYEWADAETDDLSLRRYVYESDDCIRQPMLWCPQTSPEFYGLSDDENLFRYSNVAYEILGQIVAEYSDRMPGASGQLSYEDFVAKYLLEPAGMSNSTMKTFERDGSNMANPHAKAEDRSIRRLEVYPYNRKHAPSSTLTSCTSDLLKWGRAHMRSAGGSDGLLLQKESYDSIWRDYATVPNNGEKMGLGWFMRRQKVEDAGSTREYVLYGHEGTDDGFRASFWMCPELEMITVVLSNLSNAPVKRINKKLFEVICEQVILYR